MAWRLAGRNSPLLLPSYVRSLGLRPPSRSQQARTALSFLLAACLALSGRVMPAEAELEPWEVVPSGLYAVTEWKTAVHLLMCWPPLRALSRGRAIRQGWGEQAWALERALARLASGWAGPPADKRMDLPKAFDLNCHSGAWLEKLRVCVSVCVRACRNCCIVNCNWFLKKSLTSMKI